MLANSGGNLKMEDLFILFVVNFVASSSTNVVRFFVKWLVFTGMQSEIIGNTSNVQGDGANLPLWVVMDCVMGAIGLPFMFPCLFMII